MQHHQESVSCRLSLDFSCRINRTEVFGKWSFLCLFANRGRGLTIFGQASSSQLLQRRFGVAQIRPATKKGARISSQHRELPPSKAASRQIRSKRKGLIWPNYGTSALWRCYHLLFMMTNKVLHITACTYLPSHSVRRRLHLIHFHGKL